MKALTLFTGGGGADIGLKNAGIDVIGGIEYDAEIATVARSNGLHVTTADILECDPASFPAVDFLHASPPCPNFSVAKTGAKETEHDKALARKVAEFVKVMKPKYFTLENVYKYRRSESWAIIRDTLYRLGYGFSLDHVNFADLGVPQTRKRMIVRAVAGLGCFNPPALPAPVKWVGWYEAVEDLIPTFPDDKFAQWQLDRMPDAYKSFLLGVGTYSQPIFTDMPANAITANSNQMGIRAMLFEGRTGGARDLQVKDGHSPAMTITTPSGGNVYKAFIANGTPNDRGKSMTVVDGETPAFTTTVSVAKRPTRGFINGRVVRLTPRALARFQTFPDWYQLPEKLTLAGKIIGNAVPCLGMQKIVESMV